MENSFLEIAAILGIATLIGVLGQKLRQPLIIMFLATGILAGPAVLGIIESYEKIELLAEIGIALLLFIVGLKLDLTLIRSTGPVALATGLGQIIFTSLIGFMIALALGMSMVGAIYVAVALTFSSTIIIVKLLSDKKEIDSLHGQIAIGFLIVQDIAVILALVVLTTFGTDIANDQSVLISSLLIIVKGLGLLLTVALLMRYVIPGLVRRLAYSQEILILFAISWAVILGAGSEILGFSKEIGAFLAGVSLASTAYRDSIGGRLITLRDFLLLFFFIDLGSRLDWSTVGAQLGDAAIFSAFVLIGNPLIVLVIMGTMGYRRRTSFLAGLTVAQISEFSLIIAALGLSIGHITNETVGLITLVGVITIFVSTYMILYSANLYNFLSEPLKIFERSYPHREASIDFVRETPSFDVVLMGLGNYGRGIAEYLIRRKKTMIGVDFDPGVLEKWRTREMSVLYGDITDPEIFEHLPLDRVKWVVSTIRSKEQNLALIEHLRNHSFRGKIALTAVNEDQAQLFEKEGAQVVFKPFSDAAEQAADSLTHAMDVLPENVNWPIAFREVRIQSDSAIVGKMIKDIALRPQIGVFIIAVSRAGRVYFDPGPDFYLYPGDRLVIMGPPEEIRKAESVLNQFDTMDKGETTDRFVMGEITVGENSPHSGHTLSDLSFRQKYGVTVAGISRGDKQISSPGPGDRILAGDRLIVIGSSKSVQELKKKEPL